MAARERRKRPTGIVERHSRSCAFRDGAACDCEPAFEAWVYSRRDGRKLRKSFSGKGALSAAKSWRADAYRAVERGTVRAPTQVKVSQAAEAWLAGARDGMIRARSGDSYKPSAIRGYEAALRLRVLPAIGHMRLSEVTRVDLQDLVDELVAAGLAASTIGCTLLPLRAIYRRAIKRGEVAINPTAGLELPAVRSGRDRTASPHEAARLLAALPVKDRAVWATAMYAGLRRGELQALRWSDVDLARGLIHVQRSWDAVEGFIEPKSAKERRKVPIAVVLRDYLTEHKMRAEQASPDGLVFGESPASPFRPERLTDRTYRAWGWRETANPDRRPGAPQRILVRTREDALERITLHECRHTYASLMIAAGVNAKALSTYVGHANISITLDRYGHLMPGNEDEAAGLLDTYLERERTAAEQTARSATVEGDGRVIGAQIVATGAQEGSARLAGTTGAQTGAQSVKTHEIPANTP